MGLDRISLRRQFETPREAWERINRLLSRLIRGSA